MEYTNHYFLIFEALFFFSSCSSDQTIPSDSRKQNEMDSAVVDTAVISDENFETEIKVDIDTRTETDSHTKEDVDTSVSNGTDTIDTDSDSKNESDSNINIDTERYDSQAPTIPTADNKGGAGNITTYGNVTVHEPSSGGACNFGVTNIYNFAAINVNLEPGDGLGSWREGRICGQCAEVTALTAEGPKTATVRIVDKCPDDYCGIDLGGAPAKAIMGNQPGRYNGTWKFIPCDGNEGVSDAPPSIFVKEGSNPWWAVIQIRNPPAALLRIEWHSQSGQSGEFSYASEAENFYSVPEIVRNSDEEITLSFFFDFNLTLETVVTGNKLTIENASYFFK